MHEYTLPDDLIGPNETAGILGLKVGTLASMTSRGQIPYYRLAPRIPRYSRREIVAWAAQRRVPVGGAQ